MKITQEVRDFAAKQAAKSSGDHLGDSSRSDLTEFAGSEADAQAGMEEMSKRFHEIGSELYIGAGGREHD